MLKRRRETVFHHHSSSGGEIKSLHVNISGSQSLVNQTMKVLTLREDGRSFKKHWFQLKAARGGNSLRAFSRRRDEKTTWEQTCPVMVITDVWSHKKAASSNNNKWELDEDKYYNHEIKRVTLICGASERPWEGVKRRVGKWSLWSPSSQLSIYF